MLFLRRNVKNLMLHPLHHDFKGFEAPPVPEEELDIGVLCLILKVFSSCPLLKDTMLMKQDYNISNSPVLKLQNRVRSVTPHLLLPLPHYFTGFNQTECFNQRVSPVQWVNSYWSLSRWFTALQRMRWTVNSRWESARVLRRSRTSSAEEC